MPEKEVLNTEEAAEFLGFSPFTIREYAKKGIIPARKIGKEWRIPQESLNAFLSGKLNLTAAVSIQSLFTEELTTPEHLLVMSGSTSEIYQLQAEFFKLGYQAGHRMFIGLWWQEADEVRRRFSAAGIPIAELEKTGQFTIGSLRNAYDSGGADAAIDVWREQVTRGNGDLLWGSGSHRLPDWDGDEEALLHFETNLHKAFHDLPVIALCPCILDRPSQTGFEALLHLVPHHSGALFTVDNQPILMRPTGYIR